MVGPIWVYKVEKMGKPQSKVEVTENIVNNGNAQNNKQLLPEYVLTLIVVAIILFIAHKINKHFKQYVLKHKSNNNESNNNGNTLV